MDFADLSDHPADGLTHLQRLVREHVQQVANARLEDLGKGHLIGSLRDSAQRDERCVPVLPGRVHDELGDEGDDWLDHVVAQHLADLLKAAAGGHGHTPLDFAVVVVLDGDVLKAVEQQLNELVLAVPDVVKHGGAPAFAIQLLLGKCGPELNSLGAHIAVILQRRLRSYLRYFMEIVLDVVVLLSADFDEALHSSGADFDILVFECLEDLVHDEVALLGHLEVAGRVRDRVVKCLDRQLARSHKIILVLDVACQSQHDLVLQVGAQVGGV